jgi:protein N-terminal amidase
VALGYPEYEERLQDGEAKSTNYNSLVIVNQHGDILANYRKTFLYYTDEPWACEGVGFWSGSLDLPSRSKNNHFVLPDLYYSDLHTTAPPATTKKRKLDLVQAAAGICMDLNSYKFLSDLSERKFAEHVLSTSSRLVVLSMAWLTNLEAQELKEWPEEPDLGTVGYWMQRLKPLFEKRPDADKDGLEGDRTKGIRGNDEYKGVGEEGDGNGEIIVVFANRCGEEGEARYAGSSAVMGMSRDGVRCWSLMGRGEEGVCFADTEEAARWRLSTVERKEGGDEDKDEDKA